MLRSSQYESYNYGNCSINQETCIFNVVAIRSEKLNDFCDSDEISIVIMKCFSRNIQHSQP